jgi:hypothetical protein
MMDKNPDGTLRITAANDTLADLNGVPYSISACDVHSGTLTEIHNAVVDVKANTSTVAAEKIISPEAKLFIIKWSIDGNGFCNHFLAASAPWEPEFINKTTEILKKYYNV